MPEQGSFATLSLRQLGGYPTGIGFIDDDVRSHQTKRNDVSDWQHTNFAVIQYWDNDSNSVMTLDSFNAGSRAHHSEEALLAHLEQQGVNYRPIALFTDRKPCGACETAIKIVANGKARGYDIPVYYISDYPPANIQAIQQWWQ
ncbi:nucleic acid/nucleotide deaminase domain-containing protein [Streptomyces achromogenes]|uniref:nucleic acid/nucleotide deaminase domain-containing protein n=1 Tax=Streptomyces achromogenes TaxID=67255 RepID=UPI0036A3857D